MTLIATPGVDYEELASFLHGYPQELEGMKSSLSPLFPFFPGITPEETTVFSYPASLAIPELASKVQIEPALKKIFPILATCFPEFGAHSDPNLWLVDTSARFRKNLGVNFLVSVGRHPAATAAITAIGPSSGIIGSVACLPEFRGSGYAKDCVLACLKVLRQKKKTAFVLSASEQVDPYYQKMGFEAVGTRCFLTLISSY